MFKCTYDGKIAEPPLFSCRYEDWERFLPWLWDWNAWRSSNICPRSQKLTQCSLLCIALHKKELKVHSYAETALRAFNNQGSQRLVDDLTGNPPPPFGNWCNWLEIGLGTITNWSQTNSKSYLNWSVASQGLIGDLSDRAILLQWDCRELIEQSLTDCRSFSESKISTPRFYQSWSATGRTHACD